MPDAAVSIVQQLTDARELAQRLLGEKYAAEIEPYRALIRRWAFESPRPIAQVCMALIQQVDKQGSQGDMLRAQAACFEEMAGPKEGWKFIHTSGRRHYFRDGRSLCTKWGAIAQNGLEQGENLHVDNCSKCRLLRCQEVGRG